MSLLFPRVAFAPVRCAPIRHEVAPLWSLFDDTFAQLERASKRTRKQFHPSFDVKEAKDSYLVEGELPGFNPKDLSIEFLDDGHTLQIKGRSESHSETGTRPDAAAAVEGETAKPAIEEQTTTETSSVKAHQASVEDEVEAPANASAVAAAEAATSETAEASETNTVAQPQQQAPAEATFKHWISERYTGEFSRSFNFPSRVNQEAVKASLKDGILSITLPFAEKSANRRIDIE